MKPISMVAVGPDDESERQQWLDAIAEVIDDRSFCLGKSVVEFEERCQAALEVPHAIGVSSGTDALRIALQVSGIGPGDEVIVPAFTFFASASVVSQLGATPVFADIDPETLLIDPDEVARHIGSSTRAILPVHLYGQAADLDRLIPIARESGVALIEDSAQAFGVRHHQRFLGTIGEVGAFSFYPTKNLAAAGDAGLVTTADAGKAERIRRLRVHGDCGGYQHTELGWNARMDGFQAAVLSLRLERLEAHQQAREANARRYLAELEDQGLLDQIRPLRRTANSGHSWHQFIVRVEKREALRRFLLAEGIDTGVYYPGVLPHQKVFADLGHSLGDFPAAEEAASTALALPIHPRLADDDPKRVVSAIARGFEEICRR